MHSWRPFPSQALEFQAQQRLWALQQDQAHAAGTADLQDQLAQRAAALEAEQRARLAEWQSQDEERRVRQMHEAARRARQAEAAEASAAQQAASGLLLAVELEAKQRLAQVESERAVRLMAEQQAELTAQQVGGWRACVRLCGQGAFLFCAGAAGE